MRTNATRFRLSRVLLVNSGILVVLFLLWLVGDYFYMKGGQRSDGLSYTLSNAFMLAPLLFIGATWKTAGLSSSLDKAFISLLFALAFSLLGFFIVLAFGVAFHLKIGGRL